MKKLIALFVFILTAFIVQAQIVGGVTAFATDTLTQKVTNKHVKYLGPTTPVAITGNYTVGLFVVPVNTSGTPTISAMPQGSYNNSVWFDLSLAADSVKINTAGVVKKYAWTFPNVYFRYYRILCNGYNTGVTDFTGGIVLKRH